MKGRTSLHVERKPQNAVFLLFVVVLAGTIAGSILSAFFPALPLWQNTLFRQGIGTAAAAFDPAYLLWDVCGVSLLWLAACGISGLSLAGIPFAMSILLVRGMALGAILSTLYRQQSVGGLLTAVVFVMPYVLLSTFALVLGVREALRFSLGLCRLTLEGAQENRISIRLYAIRYAVLAVMLLAAGLLQCLLLRCGYPLFLNSMTGR